MSASGLLFGPQREGAQLYRRCSRIKQEHLRDGGASSGDRSGGGTPSAESIMIVWEDPIVPPSAKPLTNTERAPLGAVSGPKLTSIDPISLTVRKVPHAGWPKGRWECSLQFAHLGTPVGSVLIVPIFIVSRPIIGSELPVMPPIIASSFNRRSDAGLVR